MAGGTQRRLDLDRLRVAACLSTFCYHAVQVFDLNPYYHVKSATASAAIDVAARLLHAVRMPLFFLIAGMALCLAVARAPLRPVMRERAWRLLPPFLVGIVLLTPWIKYLEVLDGRSIGWQGITLIEGPRPDLLVVLRRYFTQFRWFTWSHMWFPLYLFLLGGLLLGLVRRLVAAERPATPGLVAVALAAPLAVLAGVELVLRPIFPWHIPNLFWDWASMSVYVTCMVAGVAFVRWPAIEAALRSALPVSLALAACGAALYLGAEGWPWRHLGRAAWLWGVLCLLIGLGPLIAQGRIPGERWLSDGALPIYVLHHVPLAVLAFWVKDMPWPVWQRWLVIVAGAMAVTFAAYHLLVRPFDAMRFAFGMPPLRGAGRPGAGVAA